jgi:tetratricopeptide (TPR) repeat protein
MRYALILALFLFAGPACSAADDLESAFQSLKEAEANKDASAVKKHAVTLFEIIREDLAQPAPEEPAKKESWEHHRKYLTELQQHAAYALFATAAVSDPAVLVDLLQTLEEVNPKCQYLDEAYGRYFVALSKTGQAAKIVGVAEKALAHHPDNEDLLLVLADSAFNKKQVDRALTYAHKGIAVLSNHPKPASLSAADWNRKRSAALASFYFIAGLMHAEKKQYAEVDKDLRQALPLLEGSEPQLATALFHLSIANYQLAVTTMNKGQMLQAAEYSERVAKMNSPFAQQAFRNARAMRTEALKMR